MTGGGTGPIQVRDTTQVEVLESIVAKIQANVTTFADEASCFICPVPWPSVELQGNLFCTISPGDSSFDLSLSDGGGDLQCTELAVFIVSIWSRIQVDELERFSEGFVDADRGLLVMKQQVLAALAGKNLDGGMVGGIPTVLLLESLNPSKSRISVEKKDDDDFTGLSLSFEAKFNWAIGGNGELF